MRDEIMEALASRFDIEPEEDGKWDIEGYDWQSGCYIGNKWFCLAEVVSFVEEFIQNI